jgi:hypothetical protein
MIINVSYRLAEYKIIESENAIWWETHSGFCSVRMGRCFVSGSTLFIENAHTSEENGFFKYYCTRFHIVKCKPDQEEKSPSANNKFSQPTTQADISYSLGQFEIVEKRDGQLFWKLYSGRGTIKVGKGFIDGNILFLGGGEAEKTGMIKKDFRERLSILPAWKKTNYFCQHYTLYSCETNTTCNELDKNIPSTRSENSAVVFRKKSPRIIFKAIKLFMEVCALSGKRFLKWVLKFPN